MTIWTKALALVAGLLLAPAAADARDLKLSPFVGALRTVEIEIGGKPATLLFDTGAAITSVTPEFAATVGCAPFGAISGFRMDGQRVTMQRCAAMPVRIGAAAAPRDLGVFDLKTVLPAGLPHLDGVAGLDLFDGRTITLPSGLGAIRIETPTSSRRATAGLAPARLRLARESGGVGLTAFCAARGPHGDIWLLLDSGNLAGLRLHPWAATDLGVTGAHGTIRLALEGASPVDADAEIVDGLIYDGALDAHFVMAHTVTLDLARGRVWWR